MIWSIAQKEILENLTTYRFFILTALLAILMTVSIIVMYGDYQSRLENYNLLLPEQNSPNVIIPPNPLSIFAKGLDSNLGRLYEISILGIQVRLNQQSVNRLFALFTVPDMLFIIRVMLALIAILFTFDAVTVEKEQGTLRLILASGGQRAFFLFGKLIGRFALIYVPFALLVLAYAIVVSLLPDVQSGSYYWQRVGFIIVTSVFYVFAFSALGLFVSSLVHRSSTAMILGLAIWSLFVFVIPNMGTTIAKAISDVPPSERVEMQSRLAAIRAIYERSQRERTAGEGQEALRMIQQIRDANSQLLESYRPMSNELIRITKTTARISPAGALTFLLTDGTNTGLYEELKLKDAITLHVNRNFNRIIGLEKGPIENFGYHRASLSEVLLGSAFTDVLILVLYSIGFIGMALIGFLRYDPR